MLLSQGGSGVGGVVGGRNNNVPTIRSKRSEKRAAFVIIVVFHRLL